MVAECETRFEVSAFQEHGFYLKRTRLCMPNSVSNDPSHWASIPLRSSSTMATALSISYLPELGSDLVAALSGLNVHNLSHDVLCFVLVVGNRTRKQTQRERRRREARSLVSRRTSGVVPRTASSAVACRRIFFGGASTGVWRLVARRLYLRAGTRMFPLVASHVL
jgi:hypothetical protein